MTIKTGICTCAVILTAATTIYAGETPKPLVLASQGSFFVGGETKTSKDLSGSTNGPGAGVEGDVTINQMYVQYQIPLKGDQHTPVVMVHGCCLSSKTWETTPDGRMGWNEYFVRKNRSVYLADQSSRARSGFDATKINAVKLGRRSAQRTSQYIHGQPSDVLGSVSLRSHLQQRVSRRAIPGAGGRRALQTDDPGSERVSPHAQSNLEPTWPH